MYKITTISLIVLFFLFGCNQKDNSSTKETEPKQETTSKTTVQKEVNTPPVRESIEFVLKSIDGKEYHLKEIDNGFEIKELKDKAVFLLFFGHVCPPCLREIPRLIEMTNSHKDLAIIALEVQGLGEGELRDFVKRKGINYSVVPMTRDSIVFIDYIQQKARWSGAIPFLIALNKKGKVVIVHTGGLFQEQLEQVYKEVTKE